MKKILTFLFVVLFLCGSIFAQDSPLRILEKPIPDKLIINGSAHIKGVVRLKVTFLASGIIGNIVPVSSLSYGLTDNAVEAAKKIKFEPEIKNGQSISRSKTIEYAFDDNSGWADDSPKDEKAEAIIKKAVERLGGQKYVQAKSVAGSGNFTTFIAGQPQQLSGFVDIIVFPNKERTEFKQLGVKNVQTNFGSSGWLFDGAAEAIKEQSKKQIEDFQRSLRTSLDNLLRENWRVEGGTLSYAGRRQASLGKRNDVVKLTYPDGFAIEFEFSDEGLPMKSIYKRKNADGEELKEEDRFAQFVEVQGIYTPFIIDHFVNDAQISRINYLNVQFNKVFPDSIFTKPANAKELKKDLKL